MLHPGAENKGSAIGYIIVSYLRLKYVESADTFITLSAGFKSSVYSFLCVFWQTLLYVSVCVSPFGSCHGV